MRLFATALMLPFLLGQTAANSSKVASLDMTGTLTTDKVTSHSATTMNVTSSAPATGSTDTGFNFNVTNSLSSSVRTDSLVTIQNAASDRYRFWNNGTLEVVAPANNVSPGMRFTTPSGGAVLFSMAGGSGEIVNFVADNATPATFNIGGVNANSALVVNIGPKANSGYELIVSNTAVTQAVKTVLSATDSSGTPGAATINKPSGKVAVAASASSVVVTNSAVSASSIVYAVLQSSDSTCTAIKSVVPASGSFTVNVNATCTAAATVGFVVFN